MKKEAFYVKILDYYLDHPERWTQGAYGRDKNGMALGIEELWEAECMCLSGAIYELYLPSERPAIRNKLRKTYNQIESGHVDNYVYWQDRPTTSFEDILYLVRKAGV